MAAAAHTLGLGMTVAITTDEVLAPFGVRGVPATVFVTAAGRMVAAATGARNREFFGKRARALLEADARAAAVTRGRR